MSRSLWQKSRYASRIEYIIDNPIREFDISKANISILRDANVLTEQDYQYFLNAPRMERQIAIGKLQGRNTKISEILKQGILNAKRIFMEANSIDDSDILYIRNDAIAIIGAKPVGYLNISEHVHFRPSAIYSSYYKYNMVDYLYYYDPVYRKERLDVKGIGDEGIELHKRFMLDFLSELFYRAQMEGIEEAIRVLQDFYIQYVDLKLPIGYYRELNSGSRYRLDNRFSMYSTLYMNESIELYKKNIDISYNENMLRYFMKIYSSIYFK